MHHLDIAARINTCRVHCIIHVTYFYLVMVCPRITYRCSAAYIPSESPAETHSVCSPSASAEVKADSQHAQWLSDLPLTALSQILSDQHCGY